MKIANIQSEFHKKLEQVSANGIKKNVGNFETPADSPAVTSMSESPEPTARTSFKLKIKQPVRPIVASDSGSDEDD